MWVFKDIELFNYIFVLSAMYSMVYMVFFSEFIETREKMLLKGSVVNLLSTDVSF